YFAALHPVFAAMSDAHWINDSLMSIFFMLDGLEIKREVLAGQHGSWSERALPGLAALGGMVVGAGLYVGLIRDPA
ncbi:Na+/H+ antiporter NhaA, partial [Pseudomonas syringae pv. tagetis]|uniref:Na+/H+ antiporter NhaA n=1 Tax=Pseudomonas syringae group genomosp. 7 TaxID=251699 RepID=UPI00376F8682